MDEMGFIRVPGRLSEVDSFAACVQAALKHWGRNVPYDCVAGLSGAAFSPSLDEAEPCRAWWMEAGLDVRADFLGHALGFTVERVPRRDRPRQAERALPASRIRAAIDRGAVVLCRTWPCWSVVSAWPADADAPSLAGPSGAGRQPTMPPEPAVYILRPAERSLTSLESLRAALHYGAATANGSCAPDGVARGGRLYDAWAEQLGRESFCPQCGDDEWRCAGRTASRARGTQLAAVHFLNRATTFLPRDSATERLRGASCAFAAMAAALAPYARARRDALCDPAERGRYADDVRRVRDLHQQAAELLLDAVQPP